MPTDPHSSFAETALPEDLIRGLCALDRDEVRRLRTTILALAHHSVPEVRAEALNALFVTGHLREDRGIALRALTNDSEENVRARAAYAVAATTDDNNLNTDLQRLLTSLRNEAETSEVKRASYEALLLMLRRPDFPDSLEEFDSAIHVDWEWIEEIELLHGLR